MKITNLADIKYLDTACSDSIGFYLPESGALQVESETNMGLHRSTTCPSLDSDDPILNTLLHTLEDKAKAIAMERADATRV